MHRGIMTVEAPHIWILTATPLNNQALDYSGYLELLWKQEWAYGFENKVLAVEDHYTLRRTDLPKSYTWYFQDRPLLVLDPSTFRRLFYRGKLIGQTARDVFGAIYRVSQMRRTKATEMIINGEIHRIGESIPAYEIATVELEMSKTQNEIYQRIYNTYMKDLGFSTTVEENKRPTAEAPPETTEMGIRNHGIHRRLCLATFDPNLETFCNRAVNKNLSIHIAEYMQQGTDDGLSVFWALVCPEPAMPPYIDRFSFVNYLCSKSVKLQYLCGYIYQQLFGDPHAPNSTEPFTPERVLIYVFWPPTHMLVYGFLRLLGLNVRSLRAGISNEERRDSIARFNDPNSDVQVMVSSYSAGGTSINLQKGCCRLLILEVCLSIPINKLTLDPSSLPSLAPIPHR